MTPEEVAREFMKRIAALDWARDGDAEKELTKLLQSQKDLALEQAAQVASGQMRDAIEKKYTRSWWECADAIEKAIRAMKGSQP